MICKTWIYFALLMAMFSASADEAIQRGLAIAIEADRRDQGYGDFTATLEMQLHNKQGQQSRRQIRSKTLEVSDDGDKSLIIFDAPPDVKGSALLSYTHKVGDDDQWLYLPALKRVKRIASSNKSGSFMGSEFAFEDIASQEVEKYTYRYLRDEVYEGQECFVIERLPTDKNSGYTRQIVWLDKAEYRVLKTDYYDRKNSALKSLVFRGYQKYLNKYWRPAQMQMVNHQNEKSTILNWSNYQFRTGLTAAEFSQESLQRAR